MGAFFVLMRQADTFHVFVIFFHEQCILLGRVFLGAGVGVGFVVFSTYVPEISPDQHRGKLVAIQDGALSLGALSFRRRRTFAFEFLCSVKVAFYPTELPHSYRLSIGPRLLAVLVLLL